MKMVQNMLYSGDTLFIGDVEDLILFKAAYDARSIGRYLYNRNKIMTS
jgi:hypothetical protein